MKVPVETTKVLFSEFTRNKVFWVTLYTWLITQTLKVIIGVIREKRFNFRWFVGTGGMPSSHAAVVSALATSVGLFCGLDSAAFVIALLFAIIVIFDAQGVRRSTGKQAEILNKMLEETKQGKTVVIVSHNMNYIKKLCPRSILLQEGNIIIDKDTESCVEAYLGGKKVEDDAD